MKPSELFSALNGLIDVRLPAFIWGSPGIGKSEIVAQVAESRATPKKPYELRDVRLGLMDPTDIKGFPCPEPAKNQMRWLPPDFLPTKGSGLLFLDELTTAPPAVQAASYQLVLNRKVGNYSLPPGWDIVAAGNKESDRAVSHRMSTALANRLIHLHLEPDLDEWVAHAMDKGIHEHRIAFLRFRSNLLHVFDPNTKTHAFPSPRSWFFLDKIAQGAGLKGQVEYDVLKGTVGEAAATEYTSFIRVIRDLPTIDEIRVNPDGTPVPESPATLYALTTMLSMATTESGYSRLMQFVSRMPREFQVVYIRDCLQRVNKIKFDPAYSTWALANQDVLT